MLPQRLRLIPIHLRLEAPLRFPPSGNLRATLYYSRGQRCEIGGSQSGGFGDRGPDYRHAQQVRLKLHHQIVGRGSTIYPQFLQ